MVIVGNDKTTNERVIKWNKLNVYFDMVNVLSMRDFQAFS